MCVCMYKSADVTLSQAILREAFWRNPDGAGFVIRRGTRLTIKKGYFSFAAFWKAWAPYSEDEAILHFRWASAGVITTANCHPFRLSDGSALVHNGTILEYVSERDARSDTRRWIAAELEPRLRVASSIHAPALRTALEASTVGSRLAILPKVGTVILLHPRAWSMQGGVWYSNTSLLKLAKREADCQMCGEEHELCSCAYRD